MRLLILCSNTRKLSNSTRGCLNDTTHKCNRNLTTLSNKISIHLKDNNKSTTNILVAYQKAINKRKTTLIQLNIKTEGEHRKSKSKSFRGNNRAKTMKSTCTPMNRPTENHNKYNWAIIKGMKDNKGMSRTTNLQKRIMIITRAQRPKKEA